MALTGEDTGDVERIQDGSKQAPLLRDREARTKTLGLAISGVEEDLVRARQESSWCEVGEEADVEGDVGDFQDPEDPLVSGEVAAVAEWVVGRLAAFCAFEAFYCADDGAEEDHGAGEVEHEDHGADVLG